jgi:hypothetical protein
MGNLEEIMYWVMVYNNGRDISSNMKNKEDAERFMQELQNDNPDQFDDAYVAQVVIKEKDNE